MAYGGSTAGPQRLGDPHARSGRLFAAQQSAETQNEVGKAHTAFADSAALLADVVIFGAQKMGSEHRLDARHALLAVARTPVVNDGRIGYDSAMEPCLTHADKDPYLPGRERTPRPFRPGVGTILNAQTMCTLAANRPRWSHRVRQRAAVPAAPQPIAPGVFWRPCPGRPIPEN